MSKPKKEIQTKCSSSKDIESFIHQARNFPVETELNNMGRILFALDATASRQRTWDHACQLQGNMFQETGKIGNLQLQLCYFRGYNEFQNSPWLSNSAQITHIMSRVECAAGHTQISRVLQHGIEETKYKKIQAVIFIGDSMEENLNELCSLAGTLGLLATPVFLFQEGNDLPTKRAMREIARLSGGAYGSFNEHSADQLLKLLTAVAIFACGGKKALQHYANQHGDKILQLSQQLK